jgi:RNA-binding protein NOB1
MAGSWAAMAAKGPASPAPAPTQKVQTSADGGPALVQTTAAAPAPLSKEDEALRNVKKVVLDSGAIIKGGRLEGLGQKFWTIKEVLGEVKDSNARAVLDTLAVDLEVREVDPAALSAVTHFSKLTGDYQRLSIVDLKVMALTYQMERQFHGTSHLHSAPRPAMAPANQTHSAPAGASGASGARSEPAGRDTSGGNIDEDDTIDPSGFERVPLDDGGWIGGADDRKETGSVAGSEAAARPKKKAGASSLPGWGEWDDGKDDEAGWITPENLSSSARLDHVEKREDDDVHVACATLDGAMQNVLLQMGLRVVDTDGYVVKNVKQFVLKCHACFAICHDTGKQFCPACGNATMMRVSKWVQADGRVTYRYVLIVAFCLFFSLVTWTWSRGGELWIVCPCPRACGEQVDCTQANDGNR